MIAATTLHRNYLAKSCGITYHLYTESIRSGTRFPKGLFHVFNQLELWEKQALTQ